jgi:hypothetical protein
VVGRQPCRLLHRSARTGRNDEGNAAVLPGFALTAAGLGFVRSWLLATAPRPSLHSEDVNPDKCMCLKRHAASGSNRPWPDGGNLKQSTGGSTVAEPSSLCPG